MDLTAAVDVAIGLTLLYLGASLFVTIINEFVAQTLSLRGKQLVGDLTRLFDDPEIRGALAEVPTLNKRIGKASSWRSSRRSRTRR